MNNKKLNQILKEIENLKVNNKYDNVTLKELRELPSFNGLCELTFNDLVFYMINVLNDDAVPLKYLWRNYYEEFSANLWFKMTRSEGYFLDVGAHTGIYSIIGNLDKINNQIISIEPYFLNFSRLLSNLKINNIDTSKCVLGAATNTVGLAKIHIKTNFDYHTSGGSISEEGNFSVSKIKIDNFKLNKKIKGMKIDTEGHEFLVLDGAKKYLFQDRPNIIFEINEKSCDQCIELLSSYKYEFYFIDEIKKKLLPIKKFDQSLIRPEGSNCYATTNKELMNEYLV